MGFGLLLCLTVQVFLKCLLLDYRGESGGMNSQVGIKDVCQNMVGLLSWVPFKVLRFIHLIMSAERECTGLLKVRL